MDRKCFALAMMASCVLVSRAVGVSPPPEPLVAPMISMDVEADADWNRVDDRLDGRLSEARRRGSASDLEEMVTVEAVFSRRIRQAEIDAFVALGGEIDHVFQAISYGWQGRLPLGNVQEAARGLGDELVVLMGERELELYLQNATTSVRARDVWSGTPLGLTANQGSATTRIAVFDTGIDSSHTDLSGNQAFWKDYTPDDESDPIDVIGHGTHVAGIALGTGDSMGGESGTGMTLRYTANGTLQGVSSGGTTLNPTEFRPGRIYSVSHEGSWLGGGSTTIGFIGRAQGSTGNFDAWGPLANASSGYSSGSFNVSVPSLYMTQPYLPQRNPATITNFAQRVTITNHHTPNDGFPAYSGVAPLAEWAGVKVFTNAGSGSTAYTTPAFDEMVVLRETHNIKLVNLSLGVTSGSDSFTRAKVNTLVLNGILPVVAAGNSGPGTNIGDPGSAALALTVGAVNNANQVTLYSQPGATSGIAASQDFKPDIVAPGGSPYYTAILAADTNDGEGGSISLADQQANDLAPFYGTSMATPMVAGAAALVINALERSGHAWDFSSSDSSLQVKSILTATATETNQGRELGGTVPPSLQRATTSGSNPSPGKDRSEGFGALNVGAAVQAVENLIPGEYLDSDIRLANTSTGPRAWAARVQLPAGAEFEASLTFPGTHDLDLYLYAWEPGTNGNPTILASSTNAGGGVAESVDYTSGSDAEGILVVKCISGTSLASAATLNVTTTLPLPTLEVLGVSSNANALYGIGDEVLIDVLFNEGDFSVTPPLTLVLNASGDSDAEYVSKPDTHRVRMQYTVVEGDEAAPLSHPGGDSLAPTSAFNSGSLNIPAQFTLAPPGTSENLSDWNVTIDGIRPSVTAINLLDPTTTDLDEVRFEVVLSEALAGLPGLSLDASPALSASITDVSPDGSAPNDTWVVTVTLGDADANGSVELEVGSNNPDAAGNLMAAPTGSAAYTIENVVVDPVPDVMTVY